MDDVIEGPEMWFDPESTIWVPIPFEFSGDRFPTAASWANRLAADWAASVGADDWAREQFVGVAIGLSEAGTPMPGAVARWWFLPEDIALSAIVHAYALGLEQAADALVADTAYYATDGYDGAELRHVEQLDLPAFDHAVRAIAVVPIPGQDDAIVSRVIGAAGDGLYLVEVLDPRPAVVGVVAEQLPDLLGSIRFAG